MKKTDDRKQLQGFIQIEDVHWGGKRSAGKRERGTEEHPLFIQFSHVILTS